MKTSRASRTRVARRLPRLLRRANVVSAVPSDVAQPVGAKRAERRGVALILVLGSITILTVMLAEFQDEVASESTSTAVDRDALRAEYAARSAINLSRLLIATEPTIRTAIGPLIGMLLGTGSAPQIPVWEFSDRILGAFNDINGMAAFGSLSGVDPNMGKNLGMNGVRFEVNIVDEDSKINVNVASGSKLMQQRLSLQLVGLMQGPQYDPMFEQRDGDGQFSDRQTICSALVDWADVDEDMFACDPRSTTASASSAPEDPYYQMLKVPYRRKNAPYDSLAELHLVRGVSDDFYATFIDPDPDNPRKRNVTVWGQNGVNVNSANAQTLYSLICAYAVPETKMCTDIETAAKFITAVNLVRSFTSGAPLFPRARTFVKALQGEGMVGSILKDMLGLDPVQFTSASEFEKNITTKSERFSIYADGIVPGVRRETKVRIHAVVDFHNAPPPGSAPGTDPNGSASGAINALPTSTAPAVPSAGNTQALAPAGATGMSADAIVGALMPNAGGQIVYYRIELRTMARLLGIDIGRTTVRATLLRTSYRKVIVEGAGSCELSRVPDISEALRVATAGLVTKAESIALALDGDLTFLRKLELPLTAQKVLSEVVPFEIEAQIPFDIEGAVFDYRLLPREKNADKIPVLAAIAKQTDVSDRINTLAGAINVQPDVIVPGSLALVALSTVVPELAGEGPVAVADLGAKRTDIVILVKGELVYARTLSAGVAGLPESAAALEREIAQTFAAWRASGGNAVQALYLAGGGSTLHGAENYLSQRLGVMTSLLPPLKIEGWPDMAQGAPFAKAAGLALAMSGAKKSLNLRQGPLAYERGFGFVRDRIPLLAGLGAVLVVSYMFSTWAEFRSLSQEQEVLDSALGTVSKEVLGEETHDPAHATEVLEKGPAGEEDPLPKVDAFDALFKLNEAVPKGTKHDIDEFDVQRLPGGSLKVSVHGIVPKVQDADDLVAALKLNKCFADPKVVKTSPQIGGDGQKYVIEWELKCVEEPKKPKPAASAADASVPEKGDK